MYWRLLSILGKGDPSGSVAASKGQCHALQYALAILVGGECSMLDLLLNWRLWGLDLILAAITVSASVAKYEIGKGGYKSLREKYPQVHEARWDQVHSYFNRWGAPLVLVSFVPVLTWIIPPAAGAFGIRFRRFLIFAFLAKVIRYWILILIIIGTYDLVS
jgi:membrane protein YqaA with SNARE-associated domain